MKFERGDSSNRQQQQGVFFGPPLLSSPPLPFGFFGRRENVRTPLRRAKRGGGREGEKKQNSARLTPSTKFEYLAVVDPRCCTNSSDRVVTSPALRTLISGVHCLPGVLLAFSHLLRQLVTVWRREHKQQVSGFSAEERGANSTYGSIL